MHLWITTFLRMSFQWIAWPTILPSLFAHHFDPTSIAPVVGNPDAFILTWHLPQRGQVLQLQPRRCWFLSENMLPLSSLSAFAAFGPLERDGKVPDRGTFDRTFMTVKGVVDGRAELGLVRLVVGIADPLYRIEARLLPAEVPSPSVLRLAPDAAAKIHLPINGVRIA